MHTTLRITHIVVLAAMVALATASARAADQPKEQDLLNTLRTAPPADKALACKMLCVYGSEAAVPELAKLLGDEHLASWARIALEAIPGPAADEALRNAMGSLQGKLLVGTINSIGVRRDAQAADALAARLQDKDAQVASAAAIALGQIGNPAATQALRGILASAPAGVRSAVAEACVVCAERMLAAGNSDGATQLYDEVRHTGELPKQRLVEATRGAILARKTGGIELLLEQLRSPDKIYFQLGLGTARELAGREVTDALAAELPGAAPPRAALLLGVLADRNDKSVLPAVLQAVKSGPQLVRVAAIGALPRLGDESCIATLLEIAASNDAELAQAAKAALADLPGEKIDAEIASRLPKAEGKTLAVLIELVGERRIEATRDLLRAVDNSDASIRGAALTALGATVGPKQLPTLVAYVVAPKYPDDAPVARLALRAAATRMPDREACARELAAAISDSPLPTKTALVEILGAVAGSTALEAIGAAAKCPEPELQDAATRVLGEWMNTDAAPVLLDLAMNAAGGKFQGRALRGYIRLARQFPMADPERAEMCQKAMAACSSPAEKKLVLDVLGRYPTMDTLKLAVQSVDVPGLKQDVKRTAWMIAQKVADKKAARAVLSQAGIGPVKLEIVKAEYGTDTQKKDVTAALRRNARDLPLIVFSSPGGYSAHLGGDPAPGTPKKLRVEYRIDGKTGEATFRDNAMIILPMPK